MDSRRCICHLWAGGGSGDVGRESGIRDLGRRGTLLGRLLRQAVEVLGVEDAGPGAEAGGRRRKGAYTRRGLAQLGCDIGDACAQTGAGTARRLRTVC